MALKLYGDNFKSGSTSLRFLQHRLDGTSDSRYKLDFDWFKK